MTPFARYTLPLTTAVAVLLTLVVADAEAAPGRGLSPALAGRAAAVDRVERLELAPVNMAALRAEDAERARSGAPAPLRFAAPLDVDLSPATAGTWEPLDDGGRLWRLRIASPGALSLNLAFEPFDLPGGATLWLYGPDGSMVRGPYTAEDRNAEGALWTPVVLGDEVVVELHLPPGVERPADLRVARVNHGYRELGGASTGSELKQGSCNIDVVCPEGDGWRDEIRSAARITILGAFLCSGQLVNNTAEDGTPYLLTAQHCVEDASQATSVVAFWNFESPQCGLLAGGNLSQTQSGATLVSLWEWRSGSDFALIRLDQAPDPAFNVHYAGWDATGIAPPGSVGIHHPSGDEKAISFDNDPPTKQNYYGSGSHQWRIGAWDLGTTEGGSSGSCIYHTQTRRCIGTLTAGSASCSDPTGFDIYGRMDAHWTGDGSPSGRLSDWLDPLGLGTLVLDGRDPGGVGAGQTWLIPAAASTPGAGTSNWKTQVAVSNPSGQDRQARVFFVPRNTSWPGSLLSGPHVIPAGGSLFLDDPLLSLNPTSGLLYVTVDGDGTPVTTRTYNLADDGGTFGQGIPGILLDDAAAPGRLILPMVHSVPGRYRTNLGLVQTSAGSMAVRVSVHAPDGTVLGTKGYGSAAAFLQVNDLFEDMGLETLTVEGAWLSVELIGGAPAFWTAYASVIDDDTDDPTYILPVAR
ncbi:MAG TPA: hypothetical protein VLT32_03085 [Candidatus Sulfomarinibacteraceae bacterium]|nr:hypothetical protein [Candidatus Sulfomarinibacteraceae bacterium]